MSAQRYRKKPVVVEAVQWTGSNMEEIIEFIGEHPPTDGTGLIINTIEGEMFAAPGWWIIKGVKGEFYPCENEIFEMTYTLASEPQPLDDATRDVIIGVLCSQALADHLGDVRDAESDLWKLLGVSELPIDHPAFDANEAWPITRARLAEAGLPLPEHLRSDDEVDEEE